MNRKATPFPKQTGKEGNVDNLTTYWREPSGLCQVLPAAWDENSWYLGCNWWQQVGALENEGKANEKKFEKKK